MEERGKGDEGRRRLAAPIRTLDLALKEGRGGKKYKDGS